MEGYSIYIGTASTLHCRRANIIISYYLDRSFLTTYYITFRVVRRTHHLSVINEVHPLCCYSRVPPSLFLPRARSPIPIYLSLRAHPLPQPINMVFFIAPFVRVVFPTTSVLLLLWATIATTLTNILCRTTINTLNTAPAPAKICPTRIRTRY